MKSKGLNNLQPCTMDSLPTPHWSSLPQTLYQSTYMYMYVISAACIEWSSILLINPLLTLVLLVLSFQTVSQHHTRTCRCRVHRGSCPCPFVLFIAVLSPILPWAGVTSILWVGPNIKATAWQISVHRECVGCRATKCCASCDQYSNRESKTKSSRTCCAQQS